MKDYFALKLKIKKINLEAGTMVVVLNPNTAKKLGLNPLERVSLFLKKDDSFGAIVNISTSIKENEIGLYKEVAEKINSSKEIYVSPFESKDSLQIIKKKINGMQLSKPEIKRIVDAVNDNFISDIELASFMTAVYINGLSIEESYYMADSILKSGKQLSFKGLVVDKHSIGGINGRATMVVVPIILSSGLIMPKTSSRAITSAAGTADAMEVLANVELDEELMYKAVDKVGGFIAWGGAIDIAPADDKIIKIEHPLSLDPHGQVIASVLAKKASVGAKKVIIDLPVGPELKVKSLKDAQKLAKDFVYVGKKMGMEIKSLITNGVVPSGPAFGPALEAKHAMEILEGRRYDNMAEKAVELASVLLEMANIANKENSVKKARKLLTSGKALDKMKQIIKIQGKKVLNSKDIKEAEHKIEVFAKSSGFVSNISLHKFRTIARLAGAPYDKEAGVLLNIGLNDSVSKGDLLYTIYSNSPARLEAAYKYAEKNMPLLTNNIVIKKIE